MWRQRDWLILSAAPTAVVGKLKLALEAGKANPAPPVGPALGARVRWPLDLARGVYAHRYPPAGCEHHELLQRIQRSNC